MLPIHRVLGTFLSLLFFVWFASGFVMLYRSFPSMTQGEREQGLAVLLSLDSSSRHGQVDSLLQLLPPEGLRQLKLQADPSDERGYMLSGQTSDSLLRWRSSSHLPLGYRSALAYAKRFSAAEIIRVDTLNDVDTWIPYRRTPDVFPVYRFIYDDEQQTELSVSRSTAEGVQLTTGESRLWAYLGAIPHWIYFSSLRQHRDLWVDTIIVLSALGCLMCISGIWLGLRTFWQTRKSRRGIHSPYKKSDYKWHHILGFAFGLSVTVFVFSGLMSVYEVPQSLVPTRGDTRARIEEQTLRYQPSEYLGMVQRLLDLYRHKGVRSIEWRAFGTRSYTIVATQQGRYYLGEDFSPLQLSEGEIRRFVASLSVAPYRLELMREYDNYYIDRHHKRGLPVYRVELEDEDATSLYIDPSTADVVTFDRNTRLRRLLYQGLHSWVFAPLVALPLLWWGVIVVSLLGGLLVSVTGLSLSLRYLHRLRRRFVQSSKTIADA